MVREAKDYRGEMEAKVAELTAEIEEQHQRAAALQRSIDTQAGEINLLGNQLKERNRQ